MKILDYIRSLAPTYERKELMATLTQLGEELREHTLPVMKEALTVTQGHTFKSAYHKTFLTALRKRVNVQGSGLAELHYSLERLEQQLPVIEAEVKRSFSFQFSTHSLTFARANLMRYIDSADFYVRYARKMLLRLIAEEAMAHGPGTKLAWPRAEIAWLDDRLKVFIDLFPLMSQDDKTLKRQLSQTSQAEVHEETLDTAVQSIGTGKLDPMRMDQLAPMSAPFAPTQSPFVVVGKMLAEYKVQRFQLAKEEHQSLQLRLQELREMKDEGKVSPKLQKLIQHTEQRVEQLDYRLAKIEDANRLD